MSKCIENKQDLVIIGAGTSGVMCGLGALKYGLKVTLICNNNADFTKSSLLTEVIPSKALSYCANIAHTIKNAENFGLNANFSMVSLHKVNNYIQRILKEFQKNNDLENFEKLGGNIVIGNATFINQNSIIVGKQEIQSKNFIIATGTRETSLNIINITKHDFITFHELFYSNILIKRIIIIGGRSESLEIAQSLARFGCKVSIIFTQKYLFPLEDQDLIKKLQSILEKEGVTFYFVNKILEFYWQNQRKILICQDPYGNKLAVDGDEIINLENNQPNIEELNLTNANVKYNKQGILVNHKLQTTQNNIFALGSVIVSPIKSIHLIEHQANIILSNIVFKLPKELNYNLIPRIIYTYPQLAAAGITQTKNVNNNINKSINILQFEFKNLDAAIYQQQISGEIKVICDNRKILGVSILGPMATDLINEYTLAMQVGAEITEIAKNIHAYPSISQINKRVAHTIFHKNHPNEMHLEKILIKMQQIVTKFSFAN